jgi:hypothetical protein
LTHLMRDGVPAIDRADEITAALLLTDSGEVVNPDVARLLSKGVS